MALHHSLRFFKSTNVMSLSFSTSYPLRNKWRIQQGLEANPTQYGPLTNLPDYSFVDGRPVPLSARKLNKVLHQQQLCKKIVELTNEIDVGLQLYNERKEKEKLRRETIIKNKLKPKGNTLLHKKS